MTAADLPALVTCIGGRWSPGIGDSTLMGWITVMAYGAASLSGFGAAAVRLRDRRFWGMIGLVLALLCLNKQLDLQSALTAAGRCLAQMQGWYDDRRKVQLVFIIGLVLCGVLLFAISAVRLAPRMHRLGVALSGLALLSVFVAVRAAGMHHVDAVIHARLAGARVNWIIELSGIALILLNAVFAIRGRRTGRRTRPRRQDPRASPLRYSRSRWPDTPENAPQTKTARRGAGREGCEGPGCGGPGR